MHPELNWIELGPIGDSLIAEMRMNQMKNFIKTIFPVSEFSCNKRGFSIGTVDHGHNNFDKLKRIFLYGESATDLLSQERIGPGLTLQLYFNEISYVRKFMISAFK